MSCCQTSQTNGRTPPAGEVVEAPRTQSTGLTFRPAIDVYDSGDSLVVVADLPGVRSEDVDIQFENNDLTIRAGVRSRQAQAGRFLLREYGVGDFIRSFRVGEGIDGSRISAELHEGVLTLKLPKAEAVRPRKIAVNAG